MFNLAGLGWVDWVIIGLILLSTLVGLIRGFVREGLSLAVWVIAVWLALTYSSVLAKHFESNISHPSIRYGVAFAAIAIVTLIVGGFINHLIAQAVKKTGMGGTDRILGLVFGFIRGALVIAVVLLLANLTPVNNEAWWQKSHLIPRFNWLVKWIHNVLPPSIAQHLQPSPDKKVTPKNNTLPPSGSNPADNDGNSTQPNDNNKAKSEADNKLQAEITSQNEEAVLHIHQALANNATGQSLQQSSAVDNDEQTNATEQNSASD